MASAFNDFIYHYHNGSSTHAFEFLGCHPETRDGVAGFVFRVWAPNARSVSVVGDFNFWNGDDLPMTKISQSIWQAWSPHPKYGCAYKYLVVGANGQAVHKADPVGFDVCAAPDTSSKIWQAGAYKWGDSLYLARTARRDPLKSPMNIYEMHMGSWKKKEDGTYYTYREIAQDLAQYVKDMGFTHVELMPLAEYPYDPSWGYQVTHYFAPTARYGTPDDLKFLVDTLHKHGIGVLLDWVPAHFPKDLYGLYEFDGSPCYEYSDPIMSEHPDWGTRVFDFGKTEVKSFLISCAVYWLKEYHFDGLRVDAVSSMLYLDYSRPNYRPNKYGGRENLEAIEFVKQLNTACFAARKGLIMAAEESHAFPMVTWPVDKGGLGFNLKWNMGWMNDTLKYMSMDPIYRKYHHDKLTFSMAYAFSESFVLPLSHDEVVHGKCSLVNKMPGDYFCFAVRKGIIMAAEESHAFPMVTWPVDKGGLGFNLKWNMGWMNDTLKYMSMDPIYRKYHHDKLTFSMAYAFSESFVLPLSHDEVVHGKCSLVNKMPGDYFWKFAHLRLLRGYQMTMPGKKLLMMGSEFGQFIEWNFNQGLDWLLLDYDMHKKVQAYTRDLNAFYKANETLWSDDGSWDGYQWIQPDDNLSSIIAFRRICPKTKKELLVILNFTPVERNDYRLGVPKAGTYEPVFCSDDLKYGGCGSLPGAVTSEKVQFREYENSALFHVAPCSLTIFKRKTRK